MEKRIDLEKRARRPSQIVDLNLDNCRSTSIVGLTDEYTALESLSLINVGLVTLKGFPKLPNLKKLELSDNRISGGLQYLVTSPKLQYLNLSGNKIKDLDELKPLKEFKNLFVLDLFNNEATQIENYREKIFEMLPPLKFLDGFDCHDDEAPSDGDEDEEINDDDSDNNAGEEEEEADGDEESDDDSDGDGDVSLAEVYNDDLEEDNSSRSWDEEDDTALDEEDDVDSDSDDADGEANQSATASGEAKSADKAIKENAKDGEEPQARGKKRKHEV